DDALEVMGELALVREADQGSDIRQGQVATPLQELPGSFDAAGDDELVRRQPGGPLELPGEVVDAEAGGRRPPLQARAGRRGAPRAPGNGPGAAPAAARRPAWTWAGGAPGHAGAVGRPGRWPRTRRPAARQLRRPSIRHPRPTSRPAGTGGPGRRAAG